MEIRLWDPFTAVARLDRDFDDLFRTWTAPAARQVRGFVPSVDMVAEGRDVVVRLEVPGIDPAKDVEISVHDGKLVISGERRDETSDTRAGVLVRELRYGSFRREFALPEGVRPDQVSAAYDAGILVVRVRDVVPENTEPVKVTVSVGNDRGSRTIEASGPSS